MATAAVSAPETYEDAAALLAAATREKHTVRIVGAGTKLGWGTTIPDPDVLLHTRALDEILEHNAGDMTATLQAGVPLAAAQRAFAAAGQMLALDPPRSGVGEADSGSGSGSGATIGGVVATGDSGPLRHRYGLPRDLVVGATIALSDGTVARTGGKVIKNVAGYDLAKLFSGSFGTLGLILEVNVRLHPLHECSVTALGSSSSAAGLAAAAIALSAAPLEFEALDLAWRSGRGGLLARCAGPQGHRRARRAARMMAEHGLEQVDVAQSDRQLWERQRAGQRSSERAIVRVATNPSSLPEVLSAVDRSDATLVGRAALGAHYVELDPDAVTRFRADLPDSVVTIVLDAPAQLRGQRDVWGPENDAMTLMRSIKDRFDPDGTCNPGLFVGGI